MRNEVRLFASVGQCKYSTKKRGMESPLDFRERKRGKQDVEKIAQKY